MGEILIEKELEFDFRDALNAIQFDGYDHKMSHCMKAVDFLVEWDDEFWFVEVKDHSASTIPNQLRGRELTSLGLDEGFWHCGHSSVLVIFDIRKIGNAHL